MQAPELPGVIDGLRDLVTVKRVYGEAYEENGLTVIPAASVRGGGGGGEGKRGDGESGKGGGVGMMARPSGAWVIDNGKVSWKPAVDANRVVLGGQVVAVIAILVAGKLLNSHWASHPGEDPTVRRVARLVHALRRARAD